MTEPLLTRPVSLHKVLSNTCQKYDLALCVNFPLCLYILTVPLTPPTFFVNKNSGKGGNTNIWLYAVEIIKIPILGFKDKVWYQPKNLKRVSKIFYLLGITLNKLGLNLAKLSPSKDWALLQCIFGSKSSSRSCKCLPLSQSLTKKFETPKSLKIDT